MKAEGYNYRNSSWIAVPSDNPGSQPVFTAVSSDKNGNAWVVGGTSSGNTGHILIEKYTGSTTGFKNWTLTNGQDMTGATVIDNLPNTTNNNLIAITVYSANDAWAVGSYLDNNNIEHPLIYHWDGTSWTNKPVSDSSGSAGTRLAGITEISPSNIWAVGSTFNSNGTVHATYIIHWDGSSWSIVPSPSPSQSNNDSLYAIGANSSDEIYAVGTTRGPINAQYNHPLVLKFDGNQWLQEAVPDVGNQINHNLSSISVPVAGQAWSVGHYTDSSGLPSELILHKQFNITPTLTPTPPHCTLPNFGDSNGSPIRQTDDLWRSIPYGGTDYKLPDGQTMFLPFIEYGNGEDTIGAWGCNLTSAAMIVNYYAQAQGKSFRTDPQKLNEWLQHNQGYSTGAPLPNKDNPTYVNSSLVDHDKVVYYARNIGGIEIGLDGREMVGKNETVDQFILRTTDSLNSSLCALNPVILGVDNNGSGHYVDATGKTINSGIDTWRIHDPLRNSVANLQQTYNNQYSEIRKYKRQTTVDTRLKVIAHSPVEFILTDPQGRNTGFNPVTNVSFREIPSSSYGDEFLAADDGRGGLLKQTSLEITNPLEELYELQVYGTGTGPYSFDIFTADNQGGQHLTQFSGTTSTGVKESYFISYSASSQQPSSVKKKVVIDVMPGSDKNLIYPKAGLTLVALLTTPDFNTNEVDMSTIRLGKGQAKPLLNKGFHIDVNRDGKKDLLLIFRSKDTGVVNTDTQICLNGLTKAGVSFEGCDKVKVVQIPPVLTSILNFLRQLKQLSNSDMNAIINEANKAQ